MSSGASNLENLARAKQPNAEAPSAEQIGRLLASAVEAEDMVKLTTGRQRLVLACVKPGK